MSVGPEEGGGGMRQRLDGLLRKAEWLGMAPRRFRVVARGPVVVLDRNPALEHAGIGSLIDAHLHGEHPSSTCPGILRFANSTT